MHLTCNPRNNSQQPAPSSTHSHLHSANNNAIPHKHTDSPDPRDFSYHHRLACLTITRGGQKSNNSHRARACERRHLRHSCRGEIRSRRRRVGVPDKPEVRTVERLSVPARCILRVRIMAFVKRVLHCGDAIRLAELYLADFTRIVLRVDIGPEFNVDAGAVVVEFSQGGGIGGDGGVGGAVEFGAVFFEVSGCV